MKDRSAIAGANFHESANGLLIGWEWGVPAMFPIYLVVTKVSSDPI